MRRIFLAAALVIIFPLLPITAQANGELFVTELMYDAVGADTGVEWIELYNASANSVTIVSGSGTGSWRFSDGSNHIIRLVQGEAIIPSGGLFVIAASSSAFTQAYPGFSGTLATSSMALPNTGGTVGITADSGATWLAQLAYVSSWGGSSDGSSLEKVDVLGFDEATNWRSSPQPGGTPGQMPQPAAPNRPPVAVASAGQFVQVGVPVQFDASASSDPDGDELTFQWSFGDGTNADGVIISHAFSIAGLYDALLTVSDGSLSATATVAVTVFNEVADEPPDTTSSTAPVAIIDGPASGEVGQTLTFDGSRSYSDDTSIVWYVWSFGDGATASSSNTTHTFDAAGEFTVTLVVSDGSTTSSTSTLVTINAVDEVEVIVPVSSGGGSAITAASIEGQIIITELLPNPVGDDLQGEYIELQNVGAQAVNLGPWAIADGKGRKYTMETNDPTNITLQPGAYLVVPRVISGITLTNTSSTVQLLRWDGATAGVAVQYGSAPEGKSWSLQPDATWAWTSPTPGKANVSATTAEKKAVTVRELKDLTPPKVQGAATTSLAFVPPPVVTDELAADGDGLVEMIGVVTLPPGVAGKRLLYVADYDAQTKTADAAAGIGVYMTVGTPPKLGVGDVVTVRGKLGITAGERQLKVGRDGSIAVVSRGATILSEPATVADLTPESVGSFVSLSGTVVKSSGKLVTLDDGTGEVVVWFPSSGVVPKPTLKQGQQLAVVGVVRLASDGSVRVMPRDAAEVSTANASGESESSSSADIKSAPSGSVFSLLGSSGSPYLPIGLATAGVALAGAIWWVRRAR